MTLEVQGSLKFNAKCSEKANDIPKKNLPW